MVIDNESLSTTLFGPSGWSHANPVVGRIDGSTFRIQKRQPARNPFAPFFHGTFQPTAQGTQVSGHFGLHPVVTGIVVVWFIVGMVFSIQSLMTGRAAFDTAWNFPFAPILGLVILVGLGKLVSLRGTDYLVKFLKIALTAQ